LVRARIGAVRSPQGTQFFYDKAASADKSIKLYEGAFHEVFNDLCKEQVRSSAACTVGCLAPALTRFDLWLSAVSAALRCRFSLLLLLHVVGD
jgi:hypothetical protein